MFCVLDVLGFRRFCFVHILDVLGLDVLGLDVLVLDVLGEHVSNLPFCSFNGEAWIIKILQINGVLAANRVKHSK